MSQLPKTAPKNELEIPGVEHVMPDEPYPVVIERPDPEDDPPPIARPESDTE